MAYIEYNDIQGRRQRVPLFGEEILIGRDTACTISFPDKRISRNHSRIHREKSIWFVEDLGSTNGTLLNGAATARHALSGGDSIQVGPFFLAFKTDDEREPSVIIDRDELTKAVSLDMIASQRQVANKEQRLDILLEIAEALDVLGTTRELLLHFMEAVTRIFHPQTCIIALGDEYLRHPEPEESPETDVLETSIARVMGHVREKKQGVIFEASPAATGDASGTPPAQACVPILVSGEMRGVIYMDCASSERLMGTAQFTRQDLNTLVVFGRLISAAAVSSDKMARLNAENRILTSRFGKVGTFIGKSKQTKKLIRLIETKVGPVDSTVLFTGETGTGKTWAAQALHMASRRTKGPFVKVNCAAIPETLIESELFGHEKGAFSGATSRKIGHFEAAHTGTLFLDEIGELNPSSQAKLLTVLQDKRMSRVGSTKVFDVDVRIIAATNIDLKSWVESGRFRSDLYYRLNIVTLEIPPLRKRPEDILPLAEHFLERFSTETGKNISGMSLEAIEALKKYSWPGNIRELSNAIERAVIFADYNATLTLEDFPDELTAPEAVTYQKINTKAEERLAIVAALEQAKGNKREAARIMGWYPQKLYARLKEFDLT